MHAGESRHRRVETRPRVRVLAMLTVADVLAAAARAPAGPRPGSTALGSVPVPSSATAPAGTGDRAANLPGGSPGNGGGTGNNP